MSVYGQPPPHQPSPAAPQQNQRRGVPVVAVVAIAAGTFLAGCLGGIVVTGLGSLGDEEPAAQRSQPASAESSTAGSSENSSEPAPSPPQPEPTVAATLIIPSDLVGMNAAVAEDELRRMGFERIEFGSADPDDTVVILPANWTVVEVSPEPGREVPADATVVLTCTKQ